MATIPFHSQCPGRMWLHPTAILSVCARGPLRSLYVVFVLLITVNPYRQHWCRSPEISAHLFIHLRRDSLCYNWTNTQWNYVHSAFKIKVSTMKTVASQEHVNFNSLFVTLSWYMVLSKLTSVTPTTLHYREELLTCRDLNHCSPLALYGDTGMGQHWLV